MPVPTAITDLSSTAASNSPAGSDAVGTTMDDFLRAGYAFIAQLFAHGAIWAGTAGGAANALTLTPSPAITAYTTGQRFVFKASANANSAATTVAISGLAAKNIFNNGAACVGGEIEANLFYQIVYDGTQFQIDKWGASTSAFTDTSAIVKGSADATKLFRVEVDGFTAGTTRVMTPPNVDFAPAIDPGSNGIIARTAATTSAARTITAGNKITVTNGDGVAGNPTIAATTAHKFGSFTYNLTTASATQAITGVGFQPDYVEFFGAISGGSSTWMAHGWDDGTNAHSIANNPTTGTVFTFNSKSVSFFTASSDSQIANISALGADGFTLSWTKSGSPTGTVLVFYKAVKL